MKKTLKISVSWILLIMTILYFITGFVMTSQYGFDRYISQSFARFLHFNMTIPYLILLFIHIVFNLKIKLK